MTETESNQRYLNTQIHLCFIESQEKLEIVFLQSDKIKLKKYQLTIENIPDQVSLLFKTIENLDTYLKQNPEHLKITKENIPKLLVQCNIGRKIISNMEIDLLPLNKNDMVKYRLKKQSRIKTLSFQITFLENKVKNLQNNLLQKNNQIQELQKTMMKLGIKLKIQQNEIGSLKSITNTLNDCQRHNQEKMAHSKQEQAKIGMNFTSMVQKMLYLTPSSCSSQHCTFNTNITSLRTLNQEVKYSFFKQIDARKSRHIPKLGANEYVPFLNMNIPIRMKLIVNPFKIQQFFTVNELKGSNKIIQKISGGNLGHQIVFENWIYKEGCSYFRLMNQGIKSNLLFVGVLLQTKKNQKFSYHMNECCSYNCADGCIWSMGKSNENSNIGRQLKAGQVLTVMTNSNQKTIQWYIDKKLVGFKDIYYLFSQEHQQLKLHPYIQMEGVGDTVKIINEDSAIPADLNIQNLLKDQQNRAIKLQIVNKHSLNSLKSMQQTTKPKLTP